MADPTPASAIQNLDLSTAHNITDFSRGFSDALQARIQADADQQNTYLSKIGTPGVTPPNVSDVLYGETGYAPALNLAAQGTAWGGLASLLPGIGQQQLAYQNSVNAMNLAIQRAGQSVSSGGSSSSSGSSGDLTAYQQYEIQAADTKFQYQQEQDAIANDLAQGKFSLDVAQMKSDNAARKAAAKADSQWKQFLAQHYGFGDKLAGQRVKQAGQALKIRAIQVSASVRQADTRLRQSQAASVRADKAAKLARDKFNADKTNKAAQLALKKAKALADKRHRETVARQTAFKNRLAYWKAHHKTGGATTLPTK